MAEEKAVYGFQPSVKGIPPENFNPAADAEYLNAAMRGFGTQDTKLLTCIVDRTNAQRQEIRPFYNENYHPPLIDRIRAETSGKYEKVLVGLLTPSVEYDSLCLSEAMDGAGTTESLLSEIICTRTGPELEAIAEAYQARTGQDLNIRVAKEASGDYEKYLLACLRNSRPDSIEIDEEAAQEDAQLLFDKGEKKWGTDEDAFIEIISSRSFAQLAEICRQYQQISEHTLIYACERELKSMFNHFRDAVVMTLQHAFNREHFWGDRILRTMKGLGTSDDDLIRLIITRSERDLASIRNRFGMMEDAGGQSLEGWIQGDTSGHYEQVLLTIVQADQREPVGMDGDGYPEVEELEEPPADEEPADEEPPPEEPEEPEEPAEKQSLETNEALQQGEYIMSPSGQYKLIMQGDGNLVGYEGGDPFWASNTCGAGEEPYMLAMQGDGNLVIYANGAPTWASNTHEAGDGVFLVMQDDRNIVLYQRPDMNVPWASGTNV